MMHTDDVLTFLDLHPDFLLNHAQRFGLSPTSQNRTIISLTDRKILELKDKIRQMDIHMLQLIRQGEINDLTQTRLHQLTLALLASNDFETLTYTVKTRLIVDYSLCHSALRLWHPAAGKYQTGGTAGDTIRSLADKLTTPSCGVYANDEIINWFPTIPVLQSFAQIALRCEAGKAFGILVLASEDPKRFTSDMHTRYLAQLGELISVAALRVLAKDEQ